MYSTYTQYLWDIEHVLSLSLIDSFIPFHSWYRTSLWWICALLLNAWNPWIKRQRLTVLLVGFFRLEIIFKPNAITTVWRNGGNITEASALLPPVSPYEELTKRGAGQNITSMLLIRGILLPMDCDGAAGNISKIQLATDYKKKWLMLASWSWLDSNTDQIICRWDQQVMLWFWYDAYK